MASESSIETENLISNKFQVIEMNALFQQLNSSRHGLTNIYARSVRKLRGPNKIKMAGECPPWLCCLLGLKRQSKTAKLLEDCVPISARVLRDGKYILLDSESIVVGDIVKISAGQSVAADIRVFEHSEKCQFDTTMLFPRDNPKECDKSRATTNYEESPNMIFVGYTCSQGECTGLVVATGSDTLIAELVRNNLWPPPAIFEGNSTRN